MSHKWIVLCDKYELCDKEQFEQGYVIPSNASFSGFELTEYYLEITYKIEELISHLDVMTSKENPETNKIYFRDLFIKGVTYKIGKLSDKSLSTFESCCS